MSEERREKTGIEEREERKHEDRREMLRQAQQPEKRREIENSYLLRPQASTPRSHRSLTSYLLPLTSYLLPPLSCFNNGNKV
jgi:hypothetical protein